MLRLNLDNLNKKRRFDPAFIRKLVPYTIRSIGAKAPRGGINIIFISDKRIRALNRRFTGRDKNTDVLCFTYDGSIADIFISSDRASANSGYYGQSYENELLLYVIHGILHMFGYRDERAKDAKAMAQKQQEILVRFLRGRGKRK